LRPVSEKRGRRPSVITGGNKQSGLGKTVQVKTLPKHRVIGCLASVPSFGN
jgi:hypothetical protein